MHVTGSFENLSESDAEQTTQTNSSLSDCFAYQRHVLKQYIVSCHGLVEMGCPSHSSVLRFPFQEYHGIIEAILNIVTLR